MITPSTKQNFFSHLQERGLVHNFTPHIQEYLAQSHEKNTDVSLYCGFDPSGRSLQVGNLMAVLLLRRAQLHGIRPIALLGGATGLVGDPSGKKAERTLLEKEAAEENLLRIKNQIGKFIDFSPGKNQAQFVNNFDWFQKINFVEFLRDVGKHITINYMIAKDSVKLRMETGISYAEFGYMLMQGYDFLHLYEKQGCLIQLGGSDQWGNMTTGLELIRRKHGVEAHALSSPLLTDSSGNKLGKTESGAIYLDPEMTSPYQVYQYFLNTADSETEKLLKALTFKSLDEILHVQKLMIESPEKRHSQKMLAAEITQIIHGATATQAAESASGVLFSKDPASLENLSKEALSTLAREVPSSQETDLTGRSVIDYLVSAKLCESKGEARRHLQGGAVTINRVKVTDEKAQMPIDLFSSKGFLLIGLGKTKLHLVIKN